MLCYHCNKAITVSWLHLRNLPSPDNETDIHVPLKDKHICGYSCYKRLREANKLPFTLWPHIVNKSDYDGLIRPVTTAQVRKFEYLTLQEIQLLTDQEREKYLMEKEDQVEIDPLAKQIRDDINLEDERTSYLEEHSDCSEYNDDY